MMQVGYCSNPKCHASYREIPVKEFAMQLEPLEMRVYSVCSNCYVKLSTEMATAVFEEDRAYVIDQSNKDIMKTKLEKITFKNAWKNKRPVKVGLNIEGLKPL